MTSRTVGRSTQVVDQEDRKDEDVGRAVLAGDDDETKADDDEIVSQEHAAEDGVEPAHILPSLILPSQSEIEQHRVDHIPFRSWCKECLDGFGRGDPHHKCNGADRGVPVVSLDCMFLCKRGVYTRQEWQPLEGEHVLNMLVVNDGRSKAIFAHAVPRTGD